MNCGGDLVRWVWLKFFVCCVCSDVMFGVVGSSIVG